MPAARIDEATKVGQPSTHEVENADHLRNPPLLSDYARSELRLAIQNALNDLRIRANKNLRRRVWITSVAQPNGSASGTAVELHHRASGGWRQQPRRLLAERAQTCIGTRQVQITSWCYSRNRPESLRAKDVGWLRPAQTFTRSLRPLSVRGANRCPSDQRRIPTPCAGVLWRCGSARNRCRRLPQPRPEARRYGFGHRCEASRPRRHRRW
jgi:hypothetical protein